MAESQSRVLKTGAFTLAHFVNDTYPNLYPVLLPELMPVLHFGTAAAGLVSTVSSFTTQLLQPVLGFWADRAGGRMFVVGGLIVGGVFAALAWGLAPTYGVLLVLLLLSGLGNAAFHPHASSLVGDIGGRRKGLGMGLFMIGGNLGRAAAPVLAAAAYLLGGRRGLLAVALPGLIMALLISWTMSPPPAPRPAREAMLSPEFIGGLRQAGGLLAVVGLRSVVTLTVTTLVPIWWKSLGRPITDAAAFVSLLFVAGSIGNFTGGALSDYVGSKPVLIGSAVLSSLWLSLFLLFQTPLSIIVLGALLGASLYSSGSVVMVFGQALFPENKAMASGLTLGLGNTLGALGVSITGLIAEHFTPQAGLWTVAVAMLFSIPFVLRLQEKPAPAPVQPATGPQMTGERQH